MHGDHAGHAMPKQRGPHAQAVMRHATADHGDMEADFRRRFFVCALITIPVLLLSPMVQQWFGFSLTFPGIMYLLWGLSSIIALWGAWPFYHGAVDSLSTRALDMNVLVSLAVGAGYLFSTAATFFIIAPEFYWEISTLVVFLLFGHWMEMRSLRSATGALHELVKLIPPSANRITDDHTETVQTDQLQRGDLLLVRPGEQVPIDGEVVDGESEVNEALVTGEATPVRKTPGDRVIGGALNGEGAFRMRVTAVGSETAIAQIIQLIAAAQASKTRTQRLADRAATYLTLAAIIVGGGALIYWLVFTEASTVFALLRMVSVLIVACPHALGLAIPTVIIISSALGAHAGILVRNNQATEAGERLDAIIFDKTGTLTTGKFGVAQIMPLSGWTTERVLQTAAAVEVNSEHALAQAIVTEARARKLTVPPAEGFRAIPGRGAKATVQDATVYVGNQALMDREGIPTAGGRRQVESLTAEGKTLIYVAREQELVGLIALADVIRPESYQAVRELQELGLEIAMLTGDHQNVAAYVANELGLDTYFAEVHPEEKAEKVRALQKEGKRVAMVGDGINDAPALAQADVGVAIGAGTQVAIESADVVLVRNDPRGVVSLIRLSRATTRKMKENLAWATGYNVIAIPVAAGVLAPYGIVLAPEWAALLMAASSIIVVINALLLRRAHIAEPTIAYPEAGQPPQAEAQRKAA